MLFLCIPEITLNERVILPREKSKGTKPHGSMTLTFYYTKKQIGKQEIEGVMCRLERHLLKTQGETHFP